MDVAVASLQRRIDLAAERPFHVGQASVDPISREAVFGGGKERLQPQNLKVLIALTERKGRVVTRDELVERCWEARFASSTCWSCPFRNISHFRRRTRSHASQSSAC